jgi:hypothetical protein
VQTRGAQHKGPCRSKRPAKPPHKLAEIAVVLDHSLGVGDAVLPDCAQWSEDDQHGYSDVGCQEQTKGSKDQSLVHGRTPPLLQPPTLALPGFNMPPVQLA